METGIVKITAGYDHKTMLEDLAKLKDLYPGLEIENIGKSVLSRPIPAIRIGRGKSGIHYNGAFHANEWITSVLLMVLIEKCLQAERNGQPLFGADIAGLFKEKSLWVVPMVNPDGVDLVQNGIVPDKNPFYRTVLEANQGSTNFRCWKANIRGVDLNDQFPAYWEEEKARRETNAPAPLNYPGPCPLSEPEARAIADFTREMDFRLVIALHSQGEEIYWGYRDLEPPESEQIARQMSEAGGYRAIRSAESDAGYKDWFIYRWRRPGFTVECGLGQNPLPIGQLDSIWNKAGKILVKGLIFG